MSLPPLVLGIDASTTACKAVAWNLRGEAVAEGRASFPLHNPAPDAYEQDAEDWWRALTRAVRGAIAAVPVARIAGLAVAAQRETFVLTNSAGVPLAPAVVWMDNRCRPEVAEICRRIGEERLHRVTGKPACTTPSLYKLHFLLSRGRPELAHGNAHVLDVHAFLVWRLTGRRATSLASADPMGLVDMVHRCWWEPALSELGIDLSQLPELLEPGTLLGTVSARAAEATGLPIGLPVIVGAGDGQAAGLGAGITTDEEAYLNLGTAIVSGTPSRTYLTNPAFRTLYAGGSGFFLETDLKGGTFTLSWLCERLLGCRSPEETRARLDDLEATARGLEPGAAGLQVVPYWNGVMNPYWDDAATGVIMGLHGGQGIEHLYRAILEGIAFEQRLHTEGVEAASGRPIRRLIAMGGGARSDLWCQILADVLRKPLIRTRTAEATALGAGILAAVGTGCFPAVTMAATAMTARARAFGPKEASPMYDVLYREVYQKVYPALRDAMHRLSELRA